MRESISHSNISEEEKQAIMEIEGKLGFEFKVLEKDEFFYAFPTIFHSELPPKYGWTPTDDIFEEFDKIEKRCVSAVCIEDDRIIGISINYHPKLNPNYISELPESFKNLGFLKYLVISQRYLKNLDQFLGYFPNLEFLSLRNTPLDYRSDFFNKVKNLKGLDLSFHPRDDNLIKEVCKISSLQFLGLENTSLTTIPDCLFNLSQLKILDLSYKNNISSFPNNLISLTDLEGLFMDKVRMMHFPKNLQLPQNLKQIDLHNNNFTELPTIFEDLPNIEQINVDGAVVENYISKAKTQLYNEFQRPVGDCNYHDLYALTHKKIAFLEHLLKYPNTYPEIANNDIMDIKSLDDDLKWICEDQITIEEAKLELGKKKTIFELSRLNIFIGKNNSGKTFTLKNLYHKCRRIKFKKHNRNIECFYIPKNRLYDELVTSGKREGFEDSLRTLLTIYKELHGDIEKWSFNKITEIISLFNTSEKEISELDASFEEFFKKFRLILRNWVNSLHSYFPDIDTKLPKLSDFNTKFNFECEDALIPNLSYNFRELGSGMQELYVLIFFIELLKYLPKIENDKIINPPNYHRMLFIDEPDLSLHPELQEQFFSYLINASHRIQIVLTTQSPFIPKPVVNYINVRLFQKDHSGFNIKEITQNNFILIQEELFRFQPLEIASYLSKNNFEYFRGLDYKSKEFSLGSFVEKRYNEDKNYLGLLKLGTVYGEIKHRILQNAYFLSFCPENIDLNENYEVVQTPKKVLRIFIVQLGEIPDSDRRELITKVDKDNERFKSILRLLTLCSTVWDKQKIKDFILCYNSEQQKSKSKRIRTYLGEMEEDIIGNNSIILFPENILPYIIVPDLVKYAEKNKIVIIGGMEHCTLENFNNITDNFGPEIKGKYKIPIDYQELEPNIPINNNSYINQAIIINTNGSFTFQIKNIPVYLNSIKKREGIPIILKPLYRRIHTAVGNLAVLICKDLLVNSDVIDTWMDIHKINLLLTPSFTDLVNPFRNKLGEIISNREQKDKIFVFANVSEYGGSGAYNYANRRDFEPTKRSLFPFNKDIKEEEFRSSIEDWRIKDISF